MSRIPTPVEQIGSFVKVQVFNAISVVGAGSSPHVQVVGIDLSKVRKLGVYVTCDKNYMPRITKHHSATFDPNTASAIVGTDLTAQAATPGTRTHYFEIDAPAAQSIGFQVTNQDATNTATVSAWVVGFYK